MSDKGFTKNGVKFGLENPDLYHYEAFKYGNVSGEELRKEYTRLRQVANKRLARMVGTEYEDSQTYIYNAGKYTTIAQIEKASLANAKNLSEEARQRYVDLHTAKKTHELYKFLTAKTGSIRGMQRVENTIIDVLRDRGWTFINKRNIKQFGEYMSFLKELYKNRDFDSERAGELFDIAEKKGVSPMEIAEDFEYWKEHQEELANTPKIRNAKRRTAEDYKKLLNR